MRLASVAARGRKHVRNEAGFNWAQENHYACPSNYGESFEEGCVEYYNQLKRYDACKAAKRR